MFPTHIILQTTNQCNARCLICPHKNVYAGAEPHLMSEEMFAKILTDLTPQFGGVIAFALNSEPLMDYRTAYFVKMIKEKCERAITKIHTNAQLLDGEIATELLDSSLDRINFSVLGGTKENYERMMPPLKWDVMVKNIRSFCNFYTGSASIGLIRCAENANDKQHLQTLFPGIQIDDRYWATNRGGCVDVDIQPGIDHRPCQHSGLWNSLSILDDGDVLLCCNIWRKEVVLGNVEKDNVLSLMDSPLRHRNHDVCRRCK